MSDHIPDATKMIGETPRTDQMEQHAAVGLRRNAAFEQASDLCRQLERELNAANERIEALNRGNAAAERILCELTGCESGRDIPDWIVDAKERIKLLEYGIARQNLEIEQTCGKVLGYPWFKDDPKNFPGATEKDGVCVGEHVAETIAAELAQKYTEAKERIKRLEEGGDEAIYKTNLFDREAHWFKAKEAKP
jgi:hypothetical protein